MTETLKTFLAKSTIKAADLDHRRKINFNIGKYNAAVPHGKAQFSNAVSYTHLDVYKRQLYWTSPMHIK